MESANTLFEVEKDGWAVRSSLVRECVIALVGGNA